MKKLVGTLLALVMVLCLMTAVAEPLNLTMYFPVNVGGSAAALIDAMTQDFNTEHPDIHVEAVYTGNYDDTVTAIQSAIQGGNAPDLFVSLATQRFTMDAAGYFWYVGRKDDLIKSSGYRIGPFEVESALLEHEAVLEAAITGVPDLIRGQVVKATIVLKDGYIASDALKKELQNHVKRTTAPYKYPRLIDFTDALPKTASGKIRRVALR